MKKIALTLSIIGLALLVSACSNGTTNNATNNTTSSSNSASANLSVNTNTSADPEGTIIVEAGDGSLSGVEESSMDYIKESARGLEAYLGSKGATATYNVTSANTGTYQLAVKLTDDGTWDNGSRDANITANGSLVLTYYHRTEDTRGWKWFTVGNLSLKEGNNIITFSKANDKPAAYVMDEFKLVPVIVTP